MTGQFAALSNYPGGFPQGVAIAGLPAFVAHPGRVLFVDNTTGAGGGNGNAGTWDSPLATIDYAVSLCRDNKGDIVVAKPGHVETVIAAGGIDLDVIGMTLWGLGQGDDMATVNFTTATTADLDVDADNITIRGMRFTCGIANQAVMIDVNANDCRIEGCEFLENATQGLTMIDVNGGGANACDGTQIIGNLFFGPTAGNWDRAIELGEVAARVQICGNTMIGDWDDAGIHNPTGKVLTHLIIHDNVIHNLQSGQHAIELVSACTGSLVDNRLYSDAFATTLAPGSLKSIGNMAVNAISVGGVPIPGQSEAAGEAGTTFTIMKTLTSSAVVQAGIDVTGVSAGGTLTLLDVQVQADATGLAAGTNFTLNADNAKGSAVFFSTAVSGLGANTLIDLDTASVASKTVTIETGKKVIAKCTVADCTGGGTIDVYLTFRRNADGATIAAA